MDAFAVSIGKGLSVDKVKIKHMLIVGAYFGGFQALMPVIGYYLGSSFSKYITAIDHWIAFGLLVLIGANMIREAIKGDDNRENKNEFGFKSMILLAIATSIDALAVGISFAFLNVQILYSALLIGIITFVISALGIKFGKVIGSKFESKAQIIGGIILILIGIEILLSHLGIIAF